MGQICCNRETIQPNILQVLMFLITTQILDMPKITEYTISSWPESDDFIQKYLAQNTKNTIEGRQQLKIYKHNHKQTWIKTEWQDNQPWGEGIMYIKTQQHKAVLFFGEFKGMPNGYGKVIFFPGNQIYQGQIREGKAQGKGFFKDSEQSYEFEGIWKQSKPFKGQLRYGPVIVQIGEQTNKIIYPDKRVYCGEIDFVKMVPHGFGQCIFSDTSSYEGQWQDGKMHGTGKFKWNDGSEYKGKYFCGKKTGYGKFLFSSGNFYEGDWLHGLKHGKGTYYSKKEDKAIRGQWKNDQLLKKITQ